MPFGFVIGSLGGQITEGHQDGRMSTVANSTRKRERLMVEMAAEKNQGERCHVLSLLFGSSGLDERISAAMKIAVNAPPITNAGSGYRRERSTRGTVCGNGLSPNKPKTTVVIKAPKRPERNFTRSFAKDFI